MTPLTPTEIKELRIAIAESVGWQRNESPSQFGATYPNYVCWKRGRKGIDAESTEVLPPYTTSIDSIREAAMERFKESFTKVDFEIHLITAAQEHSCIWQLTALDWAIAFARTAKIWRWKV